jgi:hypothetical protein
MTIRLEVVIPDGFTHDKHFYAFGDITTKEIILAEFFCKAGWCKDLSGEIVTGEIHSLDITLDTHDVIQLENNVEDL